MCLNCKIPLAVDIVEIAEAEASEFTTKYLSAVPMVLGIEIPPATRSCMFPLSKCWKISLSLCNIIRTAVVINYVI